MVCVIKIAHSLIFEKMSLCVLEPLKEVCIGILLLSKDKRLGGYSSFAKQYFDDENFIAQYPFSFLFCMEPSSAIMIFLVLLLCSILEYIRIILSLLFL